MRWVERNHADVSLHVSWLRTAEADVQDTQLSQRWHDDEGKWLMTSEERVAGAVGLFNEPAAQGPKGDGEQSAPDPAPKRPSYFRTRVIAGD